MSDQNDKQQSPTPKDFLKNDVIGVDDWKRSKIGYISGFSNFRRMFGAATSTFRDSAGRLSLLRTSLTARERVVEMPNIDSDPAKRFADAMRFYGRSENDIRAMLRASHRNSLFFLSLTFLGVIWGLGSFLIWPSDGIVSIFSRFVPVPLTMALYLKNAYTNYILRNRALLTFKQFVASAQYGTRDAI